MAHYRTTAAYVSGAICGDMWWPRVAERNAIDAARALPRHLRPGLQARFRLLEIAAYAGADERDRPAFALESAMELSALQSVWPRAALLAS
jgi:hypothetical protein